MPSIGELRERVTFRLRTDLPSDDMAITPDYTDEMTFAAQLVQVGGDQYQGSVQIGSVTTHRIFIRKYPHVRLTVDHEAFIALPEGGDRVFRIKKITALKDGRRFLQVDVEELGITYGENTPAVF